jgi:hypothetical protein
MDILACGSRAPFGVLRYAIRVTNTVETVGDHHGAIRCEDQWVSGNSEIYDDMLQLDGKRDETQISVITTVLDGDGRLVGVPSETTSMQSSTGQEQAMQSQLKYCGTCELPPYENGGMYVNYTRRNWARQPSGQLST